MTWNGVLLRDNNNIFFPLAWKDNKEIMAYSQDGYNNREWKLPQGWSNVKAVDICDVTPDGTGKPRTVKVKNGALILSMEPNSIASITPAK